MNAVTQLSAEMVELVAMTTIDSDVYVQVVITVFDVSQVRLIFAFIIQSLASEGIQM